MRTKNALRRNNVRYDEKDRDTTETSRYYEKNALRRTKTRYDEKKTRYDEKIALR